MTGLISPFFFVVRKRWELKHRNTRELTSSIALVFDEAS
jgi:hypothetical protein